MPTPIFKQAGPNTLEYPVEFAEKENKLTRDRIAYCQEIKGEPREPTDPTLIDRITRESKSPIKYDPDGNIYSLALLEPYLPCTKSFTQLKLMTIPDLRMETHHRGRMLILERVTPVFEAVSASLAVVRDTISDETEQIQFWVHKSNKGCDMLEACRMFVLKEPYYTIDRRGTPTLQVDHQSDVVVLVDSDGNVNIDISGAIVANNGKSPVASRRSPLQCKDDGNAALKRQNLRSAHASYTEGLQLISAGLAASDDDLKRDLLRNRAYINLHLHRYDEAKSDALASLSGSEVQQHHKLDGKAYYRAARAAYALGNFAEAKEYFGQMLSRNCGDSATKHWLGKCRQRIVEQATADYEFEDIGAALSKTNPRCDVADYSLNTEVRTSSGKGRGLFATKDLKSGEMIMSEKAFRTVLNHEPEFFHVLEYDTRQDVNGGFSAGLWREVYQKLLNNPSQIKKVLDLHSKGSRGIGSEPLIVDGQPVLDAFHVHDIVATNAFSLHPSMHGEVTLHTLQESPYKMSSGLWFRSSLLNHSCMPNAKKQFIGDWQVLNAVKEIKKGEEITVCYLDYVPDYDTRTAMIRQIWDFECICPLCIAEKTDGAEVRKARQELQLKTTKWLDDNKHKDFSPGDICDTVALSVALAKTYPNPRYANLPRLALPPLLVFLASNHRKYEPKDYHRIANLYATYLATLNYQVFLSRDRSRIIDVEATAMTESAGGPLVMDLTMALMELGRICEEMGDQEGKERLWGRAGELHRAYEGLSDLVLGDLLEEVMGRLRGGRGLEGLGGR